MGGVKAAGRSQARITDGAKLVEPRTSRIELCHGDIIASLPLRRGSGSLEMETDFWPVEIIDSADPWLLELVSSSRLASWRSRIIEGVENVGDRQLYSKLVESVALWLPSH